MKTEYALVYTAKDIATFLPISENNAYVRITKMNKETAAEGYRIVRGKIPKEQFYENYGYITEEDIEQLEIDKVLTTYPFYYSAFEIAEYLGESLGYAYARIVEMNRELVAEGYKTVRGKIPKGKFHASYPHITREAVEKIEEERVRNGKNNDTNKED